MKTTKHCPNHTHVAMETDPCLSFGEFALLSLGISRRTTELKLIGMIGNVRYTFQWQAQCCSNTYIQYLWLIAPPPPSSPLCVQGQGEPVESRPWPYVNTRLPNACSTVLQSLKPTHILYSHCRRHFINTVGSRFIEIPCIVPLTRHKDAQTRLREYAAWLYCMYVRCGGVG